MALAAPFPSVRPASRGGGNTHRSHIRLTRRGRAAVFLGSSMLLASVVVATGQLANADGGATRPTGPATAVVVVQPGETLWSIAQSVAPQADPRETVQRLRDLNGLVDAVVIPGQSIIVPA